MFRVGEKMSEKKTSLRTVAMNLAYQMPSDTFTERNGR
jgi:hypothetical protein